MRIEQRCPTCRDSRKPGQLWLYGNYYLECPDCEGTTKFVMYEERVQPPPTRVFLPGLKGV